MKSHIFVSVVLSMLSVNSYAQSKGADIKPAQFDFSRYYSDPCFNSNCENPATSPVATASVLQRGVPGGPYVFRTFQPAYTGQESCTSILAQNDNDFQTVLDTGVINPLSNLDLDLTFNGEGRVQRADGSTQKGIGAVGVRMTIDEIPPGGVPIVQTELFFRWVIHTVVDSSLITEVNNPNGVNQPIINSASIRRFVTLAPGSSYRVRVNAKWSDVFTGMIFQPGTYNFVAAGGAAGALICVPTLSIAENNL